MIGGGLHRLYSNLNRKKPVVFSFLEPKKSVVFSFLAPSNTHLYGEEKKNNEIPLSLCASWKSRQK